MIRTLRHRCDTHATTKEDRIKEEQHLKKVLSVAGYPKWAWNQTNVKHKRRNPTSECGTDKTRHHVSLPYCQGISEAIGRKIRAAGVEVHMKPIHNLRKLLVAPKDRQDTLQKANVVYELKCKDCPATYIGETQRPLKARIREHKREPSPVAEHAKRRKHDILFDKVKVLDQEVQWFRLGVKEAIHIEAKRPSMNRDKGRHHLAPGYRTLLHPRMQSVTADCTPGVTQS